MTEITPDTVAEALRRDIDRSLAALASISSERKEALELITTFVAVRLMTDALINLDALQGGLGETSAANFKEHMTRAINARTPNELAAALGRFSLQVQITLNPPW